MKKYFAIIALFLFSASFVYSQAEEKEKATPSEKGKAIGEFAKSAIETIIPVWGTISSVIWPNGKGRVKKEKADKAVDDAEEGLKEKQQQELQSKFLPVKNLIEELRTVYQLAEPSVLAQNHLHELTNLLRQESIDWTKVGLKRNRAKEQLDRFDDVSEKQIRDAIPERTLENQLLKLKTSKSTYLDEISTYIGEKNKNETLTATMSLLDNLEPTNRLTGGYIYDIYNDLQSIDDWIKGGMSGQENSSFKTYFMILFKEDEGEQK